MRIYWWLMALSLLLAPLSAAVPVGATVAEGNTVTLSTSSAGTASAWGGNITQVNLTINSSTLHWQGFYGSVTGSLLLGVNETSYLKYWSVSSVAGQIYASQNSNVDFSQVTSYDPTLSNINTAFSFLSGAADDATATFTSPGGDDSNTAITVGSYTISANTRPSVFTRNATGSDVWETIVLAVGSTGSSSNYVFAGVINSSGKSFNNVTADYQIIVPEDSAGNTNPTTYYFYGELQ